MSTSYRYALPVEQTEWKFDGHTDVTFTWEYDENRAGLLQLYSKGKQQQWDAADRMGLTRRIEETGAIVAAGICFYQSYAAEMAEANGWQRLVTNSAKLVNIIGGYGYRPTLLSLERCVDSAIAGRVV